MKRLLKLAAIATFSLALGWATGCTTSATNPATLAPGYQNPADQTMGQTLAAAHAFYQNIQQDSAAGKVTLSAAEKTALNDLGTAINVAQTAYLAYHNGQATQAQAQAAVDQASTKLTTAQALIPGVK